MPKYKFCSKCGAKIFEEAEICPKCGVRQMHPQAVKESAAPPPASETPAVGQTAATQSGEEKKSPGIAAVLSFFWCGLGHIYCGELTLGLGLLILYPVAWVVCALTIVCIPVPIIMWIWAMYDSYSLAKKINRGEK